jgi:Protein kinase domain
MAPTRHSKATPSRTPATTVRSSSNNSTRKLLTSSHRDLSTSLAFDGGILASLSILDSDEHTHSSVDVPSIRRTTSASTRTKATEDTYIPNESNDSIVENKENKISSLKKHPTLKDNVITPRNKKTNQQSAQFKFESKVPTTSTSTDDDSDNESSEEESDTDGSEKEEETESNGDSSESDGGSETDKYGGEEVVDIDLDHEVSEDEILSENDESALDDEEDVANTDNESDYDPNSDSEAKECEDETDDEDIEDLSFDPNADEIRPAALLERLPPLSVSQGVDAVSGNATKKCFTANAANLSKLKKAKKNGDSVPTWKCDSRDEALHSDLTIDDSIELKCDMVREGKNNSIISTSSSKNLPTVNLSEKLGSTKPDGTTSAVILEADSDEDEGTDDEYDEVIAEIVYSDDNDEGDVTDEISFGHEDRHITSVMNDPLKSTFDNEMMLSITELTPPIVSIAMNENTNSRITQGLITSLVNDTVKSNPDDKMIISTTEVTPRIVCITTNEDTNSRCTQGQATSLTSDSSSWNSDKDVILSTTEGTPLNVSIAMNGDKNSCFTYSNTTSPTRAILTSNSEKDVILSTTEGISLNVSIAMNEESHLCPEVEAPARRSLQDGVIVDDFFDFNKTEIKEGYKNQSKDLPSFHAPPQEKSESVELTHHTCLSEIDTNYFLTCPTEDVKCDAASIFAPGLNHCSETETGEVVTVDDKKIAHTAPGIHGLEGKHITAFRREGSVKRGKWKLGAKIGVGAFGVVHIGMNTCTGALMAVKSIKMEPSTMKDAEREIQLLKTLRHENIVRYLGAEMDAKYLHIFQEWVPAGSVTNMLSKFGPFPSTVVRNYLIQVLHGLQFLHMNHIMHRDIKGSNILVSDDGIVKLADFGASKRFVHLKQDMMMSLTMRGSTSCNLVPLPSIIFVPVSNSLYSPFF